MTEKKQYDVGCVCMFNMNIGNNLTNMALYNTLIEMGKTVLMIGSPSDGDKTEQFEGGGRFIRFLTPPYLSESIIECYENKWQYYPLNEICRMFLVGSDQLWRGSLIEDVEYFYALDWVCTSKYKMSYATSFGVQEYDSSENVFSKEAFFLNRFNSISVREANGTKTIELMNGRHAEVVLDPVFLCNPMLYEKMAEEGVWRLPKPPFVGAYLLDITDNKCNALKMIADSCAGGEYRAITDYPEVNDFESKINIMTKPLIEEWLAMIRKCGFLVTDSFHGICFAIIFRKQFLVIFDRDNWRGYDRIKSILELFGLEDRISDGSFDGIQKVVQNRIDYDRVYEKLESEKKRSLAFLERSIDDGSCYQGKWNEYDEGLEREYRLEMKIKDYKDNLLSCTQFLRWIDKGEKFVESLFRGRKTMKELIGFGCGDCFKRNIEQVTSICDMKYVCDNDPMKWGKVLECGVICISPLKLREMCDPAVVIMVDDMCRSFDIVQQLGDMGITNITHIENLLRSMKGTELRIE